MTLNAFNQFAIKFQNDIQLNFLIPDLTYNAFRQVLTIKATGVICSMLLQAYCSTYKYMLCGLTLVLICVPFIFDSLRC